MAGRQAVGRRPHLDRRGRRARSGVRRSGFVWVWKRSGGRGSSRRCEAFSQPRATSFVAPSGATSTRRAVQSASVPAVRAVKRTANGPVSASGSRERLAEERGADAARGAGRARRGTPGRRRRARSTCRRSRRTASPARRPSRCTRSSCRAPPLTHGPGRRPPLRAQPQDALVVRRHPPLERAASPRPRPARTAARAGSPRARASAPAPAACAGARRTSASPPARRAPWSARWPFVPTTSAFSSEPASRNVRGVPRA